MTASYRPRFRAPATPGRSGRTGSPARAPGEAFFALDAAIRGWQAASGDKARLHPGGPEFDAVARQRPPFS